MATANRIRKPRQTKSEPTVPSGPPPYSDPGWICKATEMVAPWDGVSPSWIEREASHLIGRIHDWQRHPQAPPEHAARLAHDAWVVLTGMVSFAESLRQERSKPGQ
jgi:hypothetical protein